jgi:pimeloyl-ACP methyl ester carboxylesterase
LPVGGVAIAGPLLQPPVPAVYLERRRLLQCREDEPMMKHFKAADGASLAFRDDGEGIAILALAGLTRDSRDFDYLADHLDGVRLIRLDSRGRGASEWTGAATYTIVQEASDALALLDHLALPRAAIIGSSRGGLIGLLIAATARDRLSGLCLNDVGPELQRSGLERIAGYLGVRPQARTLDEVAERLAASPGFDGVPARRWQDEAARHFVQTARGVDLPYDPALRQGFESALAGPAPDLWPLFDACAGMPLAVIRGANSDLLGVETVRRMRARRPDMLHADVPGRGHIPFLDEPEALACIRQWLLSLDKAAPAPGA